MSLATWKREFYRTPADKGKREDALAHSILKWNGLSKEELRKHELTPDPLWKFRVISDRRDNSIEIDAGTCALCRVNTTGTMPVCDLCEIKQATGTNCNYEWMRFVTTGNPKPMQQLLARAKRWADSQTKKEKP